MRGSSWAFRSEVGVPDAPAAADPPPGALILHASAVALARRALLLTGPSGSGKSGLALQLMALGARLVADDRTLVLPDPEGGPPSAAAPGTIRGMIEARGLGLLAADPAPPTPIVAVVDLSRTEAERLPPERTTEIAGVSLPLFHKIDSPSFPAALIQYLKGGACVR